MRTQFKKDFKKATNFYLLNKDKIDTFFKGKLFNIELDSKKLSSLFDQYGSTDAILKSNTNLIFGIAIRINFKYKMHNKVTIRYSRYTGTETEFYKTLKAFKNNSFNSNIGIQIDANGDDMVGGVVYDRKSFFLSIKDNLERIKNKHLFKVYEKDRLAFNEMLSFNYSYFEQNNIKHKKIIF